MREYLHLKGDEKELKIVILERKSSKKKRGESKVRVREKPA